MHIRNSHFTRTHTIKHAQMREIEASLVKQQQTLQQCGAATDLQLAVVEKQVEQLEETLQQVCVCAWCLYVCVRVCVIVCLCAFMYVC